MNIRDYTVQPLSESLNDVVGRVVRCASGYFLLIDCAGKYGWVDLQTGHAHLPEHPTDVMTLVRDGVLLTDATLTIGDPQ